MAKKYNCKTCGAELYFDPKTGKLACEYCGSAFDPTEYGEVPAPDEASEETGQEQKEDQPEAVEDEQATDDSVSADLVMYQCPHCGAEIITSSKTAATTCVYCNRAITLEGNLKGDFKPDYVLPFLKERSEVVEEYKKLCKQSILTPRLFTKESTIQKIKGMYVPYWLFSFDGQVDMTVDATNVRVYRQGDTEITETEKWRLNENGSAEFEHIPADALKALDNIMMDSIEPYDFSRLEKFTPAYLAGFYTQRWDDDISANEPRAKARAKEALSREAFAHTEPFGTKHIVTENYTWTNIKTHYVMLPVWMMYTEYKGKNYIFGMNGQTGKMIGEVPKDPMTLVEYAAAVFVISQIVLMIVRILGVIL